MTKDINKRLSAADALKHPWIQKMVKQEVDQELLLGSISNMKTFNAESKLRHATLTFMVTQLSTKAEENRLRKSFNQFDKNGDGKVDLREFIEAYKLVYPHIDKEEVEKEAI